MGLFTSLYAGRESMISHGTGMATVGDNLANANTVGFKSQHTEFSTLLAENIGSISTMSNLTTGNGVMVDDLTSRFNQGGFEDTDRQLDAAIDGQGFFVLNDGTNNSYSRAGNFTLDNEGNLINQTGDSVMGFTAANPDELVALNLSGLGTTAEATTAATISGNLDNSAIIGAAVANPATFAELNAASQYTTTIQVVDSLGERHDAAFHFFHTDVSTWEGEVYLDGAETGGVEGTPTLIGSGVFNFGTDGTQADGAGTTITLTPAYSNGAEAGNVAVDMSAMTGLASSSAFNSVVRDGTVPGNITDIFYEENGALVVNFDNGEQETIGSLAIASFINPDGLRRTGNTKFNQTKDSGEAVIGAAETENRGTVKDRTLESSNTDMSREFVDMIRFQRGYQAGSRVVSTSSELIEATINIA